MMPFVNICQVLNLGHAVRHKSFPRRRWFRQPGENNVRIRPIMAGTNMQIRYFQDTMEGLMDMVEEPLELLEVSESSSPVLVSRSLSEGLLFREAKNASG